MKRTIIAVGIAICGVAAFPVVRRICFSVPELVYRAKSPSIKLECMRVQPGMDSQRVIEIFNEKNPPLEQSLSGNRAVFGRFTGACYVEFDANGHVTKTSLGRPLWQY